MRIALLSYRSKPHCGGQGVYVRHLSRELVRQGHEVDVFSGQPYPELDPGPRLVEVPSLDLYNDANPFRTPRPSEFRDAIDLLELGTMYTAGFPEPRTFSLRMARLLKGRLGEYDVIHDNQCLGSGLLALQEQGFPVVATLHHPITRDRRLALAEAKGIRKQITTRRWFGFLGMQKRVARRIPEILTVSESSARDIVTDFGLAAERIATVPLGVDTERFHPGRRREPGRIVCVASADEPLKGVPVLLRALARVLERRPESVRLTLVSKLKKDGDTARLIGELGLTERIDLVSGVDDDELARLVGTAEISVVPSMYEGFSLPAVEAMASGCALVASNAGALPEVVGTDRSAGILVTPGDDAELADTLLDLLGDAGERARLSEGARARVMERYSWAAVARRTVSVYEAAIARTSGRPVPRLSDGPTSGPTDVDVEETVSTEVEDPGGPGSPGEPGETVVRKNVPHPQKQQEDASC